MLQDPVGEMTEIDIDNSQIGGVSFFGKKRNPDPPPRPLTDIEDTKEKLIDEIKKLNIDNASIILNINKINILSGDDNTSKFFYILDKGIRPLLQRDNNIELLENKIIDNILKDLYLLESSSDATDTLKVLIKKLLGDKIDKYKELNIKKYLFLLLEPGLLNDKDNIKAIFDQFKEIKFSYKGEGEDTKLGDDNRKQINSFEGYIVEGEGEDIKYKKFLFLFLKIIKEIIEGELKYDTAAAAAADADAGSNANSLLKDLYDTFDDINPEDQNLDENIKKIKGTYAIIKNLLDDNTNNTNKIDDIIRKINILNEIEKYKNIGYYINFNGFTVEGNDNKKNFIKVLIFLLYNIDKKNNNFEKDKTSFANIFDSNNKDTDIQTDDETQPANMVDNIVKDAIQKIDDKYQTQQEQPSPQEPDEASQPEETPQHTDGPGYGGKKTRTQKSRRKLSKNKTR
jgi:hypothetical protein